MVLHPELGYFDEESELTDPALYTAANRPFGEATVLPPVAYRSKIFSELEDEKIWTRAWVAIGTVDQIPNAGDMLPFTVGHHGIHVQREPDGTLVGRFNKAQHGGCRAVPLQCQTGVKTKCSFTSCGFSRDREVIPATELGENTAAMQQYLGLRPERLLPIKVETWGPFIFVNLDPESSPLIEELGALPDRIDPYLRGRLDQHPSIWAECAANWKLIGRAFCGSDTIGADADDRNGKDDPGYYLEHDPSADAEDSMLCWVFPNLLLDVRPTHIACFILQPVGMAISQVRFSLLVAGGAEENSTDGIASLTSAWQERFSQITASALDWQQAAGGWGTALRPDTIDRDLPLERNSGGYLFQRYVTRRILAEHEYHWASPLYGRAN